MSQHKEWSVIVCLVGGGQEINTGEAGITEWIRSLKQFPEWKVYLPKELRDELTEILLEKKNEVFSNLKKKNKK